MCRIIKLTHKKKQAVKPAQNGADERTRTFTPEHKNLNLACLPVPPHPLIIYMAIRYLPVTASQRRAPSCCRVGPGAAQAAPDIRKEVFKTSFNHSHGHKRSSHECAGAHTWAPSYDNGDPTGTRTRVTAVKGRCLNRLTMGPKEKAATS